MSAMVVLGLFWLLGPGLFAPVLLGRRHERRQHRVPSRFEHLRATSTYRRPEPMTRPLISFRSHRPSTVSD